MQFRSSRHSSLCKVILDAGRSCGLTVAVRRHLFLPQMVEMASKKFVCIVDDTKLVEGLGGSGGEPVR